MLGAIAFTYWLSLNLYMHDCNFRTETHFVRRLTTSFRRYLFVGGTWMLGQTVIPRTNRTDHRCEFSWGYVHDHSCQNENMNMVYSSCYCTGLYSSYYYQFAIDQYLCVIIFRIHDFTRVDPSKISYTSRLINSFYRFNRTLIIRFAVIDNWDTKVAAVTSDFASFMMTGPDWT